jgi:hypothetical protein
MVEIVEIVEVLFLVEEKKMLVYACCLQIM